ncbi:MULTISPECIES: SlyX family protein [Microvirga]|jgi:SlyX protein|uniref:Protein SlyX homolog n=1 Tax=Microvirga tunisiensis TaxID=2108360 RepID=A0A5N7MEI0_9HYPH|nr:SlyX family protein [Microvirga tunisiensis]MPR06902.1 SlyX family protein [Microvirga tunisiensis]MPR25070.1 SlyX family protein [Microvirga tunisiensis]
MSDLEARIEALEVRVAYQDQMIEDLNQTVIAQWKQIDSLKRQLNELLDRVQEVADNAGGPSAPEPPPPHY